MALEQSEVSTSGEEFQFSEEDEIMEVVVEHEDDDDDDDDVVVVVSKAARLGSAESRSTVADVGKL